MKKLFYRICVFFILGIFSYSDLIGQSITIKDTLKKTLVDSNLGSDSSFHIQGEVLGMDNGSLKISSADKSLLVYVPFRNGKFYVSGFARSVELVNISINGDYYENAFYIEPGNIRIKYIYHGKFTAMGTHENDLANYFNDTLNLKNSNRFWELGNAIDSALLKEDLLLYLNLIDSLTETEKNFFKVVDEAIIHKKVGFYLLGCINYYYINYGYFSERHIIFDKLPSYIKNTRAGKETLAYLEKTKLKNALRSIGSPYQFTLKDINNKFFSLNGIKAKIIVLDFWASWCLPCIKALPLLKKISKNEVAKDVDFISISIDKNEKEWREKEKLLNIPWLSLLADTLTTNNYDIDSVPAYIVINKEGKIAGKTSSLATLYNILRKLNN